MSEGKETMDDGSQNVHPLPGQPVLRAVAGQDVAAAQAATGAAPSKPAIDFSDPNYRPTERMDPLLQCLVIISRLFGRPKSAASLAAGVPIPTTGLNAPLFVKAADRIGLAASLNKRKLKDIRPIDLPCVILGRDGHHCVMLSRDGDNAEIATPENLDGSITVGIDTLEQHYLGHVLLVRSKIRIDQRASDLVEVRPESWFWGTVRSLSPIYGQVMVAAIVINLFATVAPLFAMQVYDRVVPNQALETLWVLAIGVTAAYIFDFVLRTLRGYFLDRAGKTLDKRISARIFEHLLSIKMVAGPQSAGAFASNVTQYESLREFFTSATLATVVDLPFVIIFIGVISLIAGPVSIVAIGMIPLILGVSLLAQIPVRRAVEKTMRESAQKHAVLVEAVSGLSSIKAACAEGHVQRNWDGYVAASASSAMSSRLWALVSTNFTLFMSNMTTVLVILWGVYRVRDGEMTTGTMVAVSMLISRAMAPLGQIAALVGRFHHSWAALKGLNKLMSTPSERPVGKVYLRRPHISGHIEFRDVSFKYPGQQGNALDKVSFTIKPGERVGIIGKIGSGKTTIERLAVGLFEPESGAVLIDGIDIRQVDPADLRRQVGCVLQDAHVFFGSIKDNIILGAPYVDEEAIIRTAVIAGVDQFVRGHPHGFDMQVGENGRYLSGGQRQSVVIARAMLMNPPILIMDEPTSAMDSSTEIAFKDRMAKILPGKTLLLVTHRGSMLSLVERLIVMDGGRIVADGPRDQVLEALNRGQVRAATS